MRDHRGGAFIPPMCQAAFRGKGPFPRLLGAGCCKAAGVPPRCFDRRRPSVPPGHVVRGKVEVHTGAELDHADAFPFFAPVAWLRIADDAPGYEARDLHHDEIPVIGLQGIGAAFVIPGGFVQGGVEEFAGVIADVVDAGIDRHPVHVHVEKVHEDADAGEPLARERFAGLLDPHDPAVGRTEGAVLLLWADPFGITEKMAGQPEHEQEGQGREPEPQEGEQERAERHEGEERETFPANAGFGMFHGHVSMRGGLLARAGGLPQSGYTSDGHKMSIPCCLRMSAPS